MKTKIEFTGTLKELQDLLSTFNYKYDKKDYTLSIECDIKIEQIQNQAKTIKQEPKKEINEEEPF